MGGPSSSQQTAQNIELQNSQTEANALQQYLGMSQSQIASGNALEQPAINFYSAIASGNKDATLSAAAPIIGNISNSTAANKENIFNSVAPGAARDFALAQNQVNQGTQTASALNNVFTSSFGNLAQIGAAQQGVGLQEAGAGLNAGGLSSQGAGSIVQQQQQQKSQTLGFIGELAGAGGTALSGTKLFG